MSGEDSSSDEVRYFGPIFEFDTNDPEFGRGAEVGYLHGRLSEIGEVAVEQMMQRANEEMLRRIAEAHGREYTIEVIDKDWMMVHLEPPTMPNVIDALKHRPKLS
jgi:hypothetical protein